MATGAEQRLERRACTALIYACPNCNISYEELEPRTFSFNSPYGACPECDGLGIREEFDTESRFCRVRTSHSPMALLLPWKGLIGSGDKESFRHELDKFLTAPTRLPGRRRSSEYFPTPRSLKHLLHGQISKPKFLGALLMLEKQYRNGDTARSGNSNNWLDVSRRGHLSRMRGIEASSRSR